MTTDERIKLSKEIYSRLVGVGRSEWLKWVEYYKKNGFEKAFKLAELIKTSPSFRRGPQMVYKNIGEIIGAFKNRLRSLSSEDVIIIFGYVGQCLVRPLKK